MREKRTATKMAEGVTLLKGIDFECCIWLVEGTDSALLIDTGLGLGDLRAEVEELTKLPCKVVNTHGHGDHSGGNYQFPHVYMHKNALPSAERSLEMTEIFAAPEELDSIRQQMDDHKSRLFFIKEGDVFDLGGRKLEVIETPGHTPGDITLFDRDHGLLFSGDCMLKSMDVLLVVPQALSVACYAESMKKLTALDGVKGFCSGHDCCIMPRSFLQDCAECAEEIVSGTANCYEIETGLPDVEKYSMRATHGDAAILYSKNKIY